MKRNEGITLIALIITIVILIILTAITINSITSTNLFGLAKGAAENYIEAGKDEQEAIDDMISKVHEIEEGLGNGGTEEETENTEEDLYRYILGEEKTGRDMDEISNCSSVKMNINSLQFTKDDSMVTDISTSVTGFATGYQGAYNPDIDPVKYLYIRYNNKIYRITIEEPTYSSESYKSTNLEKVYEPKGREGQTVEYSYDGQEEHKKQWTIIKDNQDGTVEIVSPEALGDLKLGVGGSIESEGINEDLEKTIEDYNNAIEKINEKCKDLVTNENKVKVRSVGAETDNTNQTYTSEWITAWAETYPYLTQYNGKGKNGDTCYEDDFIRMSYYDVFNINSEYWVASRYIYDSHYNVLFDVYYASDQEGLTSTEIWFVQKHKKDGEYIGFVDGLGKTHGVRPVVKINYPITEK